MDEATRVERDLLSETVENGKTAWLISTNQPPVQDIKIQCDECGNLSQMSTLYTEKKAYEEAIGAWDEEALRVALLFHHYASGLEQTIAIIGVCTNCGKVLEATVCYIFH